jgi:cardiolipin synthase
MNWPNLISICRLLCVPLVVWLVLTHNMIGAFFVFLGASISDFFDGFLARRLKKHTQIGAYLDPLADKCLLVALTLVLAAHNFLPLWFVILVVFRDLLIVVGALLNALLNLDMAIQPLWISKINTCIQMILVTCILFSSAFGVPHIWIWQWLIILCGATTVLSGGAYVHLWIRRVNQ